MSIRKPKKERIRELREEALELLRKGSNAAALVRFTELERLAPDVAEYPQRAADCHRALGDASEQVDALGRAAELYANQGALAKAIALCKVILGVDPKHTRTQARLAELNGARPPAPGVVPQARPQPPPRLPVISMPAGSVVLSSVPAGTAPSTASAPAADWSRPRRSLEQMLRLRRAELAKAKLPTGAAPAQGTEQGPNVADAVSDSILAPDGPSLDSMLAPEPVPVFDSVVAPEPTPMLESVVSTEIPAGFDSVVAPEPSPPFEAAAVEEPSPTSTVPTPEDSMIPAPESIAAPEPSAATTDSMPAAPPSVPRVSASVLLEPSASIPVLEPYVSEPPPDSDSDTAITNRLPPPTAEAERALPFLPEGALNRMVQGSSPIPGPRGTPSGMYKIDLGELCAAEPPDPRRLAERALPVTPLFSELGPESLAVLIANAKLLHFEPGATVYRQNDPSDRLFVVATGLVSVATEGENGVEIARLGENEFFGETALISNELRLSTARALEPTDVLAVDRRTVTELVQNDQRILKTVLRFLRERLVESMLLTNPLFTLLTGGERRELAKRFEFIEFDRGSQLVRQRNRSPGIFVLLCGTAEVTRREGNEVRLLALLHAGSVFGEMSLVGRDPACADVRSMSRGFALMLPEHEFRRVCAEHPQVLEFVQLLAEARKRQNAQTMPRDSVPAA
jgi:CRP-like cAMP-binding protein